MAAASITRFILIAFAISYLAGVPLMMFVTGALPPDAGLLRLYLPRTLIVCGPAIAALIVAARQRPGGVSGLLRRLVPRHNDVVVAAGVAATAEIASAGALLAAGISISEVRSVVIAHPWLLAGHFALQLSLVSIGEELGWRGWLVPELADRMSRLRATAITAAIWALWHGPLLFGGLSSVVLFVLGVFGLSVLFATLVFHARGGIFAVVVAHASVNTPFFFLEQVMRSAGTPDARLLRAWAIFQAISATTGLIVLLVRWPWWRARSVAG